jgi:hypothetical protein
LDAWMNPSLVRLQQLKGRCILTPPCEFEASVVSKLRIKDLEDNALIQCFLVDTADILQYLGSFSMQTFQTFYDDLMVFPSTRHFGLGETLSRVGLMK